MLITLFFCLGIVAFADGPNPPPINPNDSGPPVGAPIDDGLFFLLVLGAGYGAWKLYKVQGRILALKN